MEKKKLALKMYKKENLIFLTNDDGYSSQGLKILKNINKLRNKNIWTFAPKFNQSAKSQAITINQSISLRKVKEKDYIVNGTPCDCVILGLHEIRNVNKNSILLISGINEGVNLVHESKKHPINEPIIKLNNNLNSNLNNKLVNTSNNYLSYLSLSKCNIL